MVGERKAMIERVAVNLIDIITKNLYITTVLKPIGISIFSPCRRYPQGPDCYSL